MAQGVQTEPPKTTDGKTLPEVLIAWLSADGGVQAYDLEVGAPGRTVGRWTPVGPAPTRFAQMTHAGWKWIAPLEWGVPEDGGIFAIFRRNAPVPPARPRADA